MLRYRTMFTAYLLESFCSLQTDRIINVRLELSDCLKETAATCGDIPKIQETISRLKFDSKKDNLMAVKDLKGPQEE